MTPRPLISLGLTAGLFLTATAFAAGEGMVAGELVRRLGDPAFAERERASDGLRHLGRAAVAALEAGLKDPDAEVRRRCAELLPLARRSDLDVRLDEFVAGPADGPAPLPGWTRFRKLAGDDRPARVLFVALGRADRALLEALEKDPDLVGAQLGERCRRVAPRRRFPAAAAPAAPAAGAEGEAEALLLVAACSTEKNTAASHQFFNGILYQPGMRSVIRSSPAARRLLTPFIARQIEEPWRLHQAVWLARNLGLDDLTEDTLKPAARKQAAAAAARPDSGQLYQAASVATALGLHDTIEGTLKPAARTLAEKCAEKPGDLNQLNLTLNVLQTLGMQDVINATLKPAACRGIAAVAEKPYDQYAFHMALNLARMLDLKESVEQVLKPAAVKAVASMAQQIARDPDKVYTALNLVQTFELKEAGEDLLKPAARKLAESAAKSGDLGKLTQAANLVGSLDLKDASEKTLQPAVRKLAAEPTGDPNRLFQLVNLAQKLGMKGTIDDALKPRAREVLAATAAGRPVNHGVQSALQLARTLDLKEGVPLALKAARAADLNAATRGTAVMFVAEFGGKEHVGELEPLLTDTASIGSMGFNFTTIHTELRDVALAAVVTLSGQSLDDYGYPYMKFFGTAARPLSALSAHCYGFSDAAGREAALKRWKESRAAAAGAGASGKASGGR